MTNIFDNFRKILILFLLFVIFIMIICQSKLVISSTLEAIYLFINNLFPCMFIFYTLSDLLINYDVLKLFNTILGQKISNFFKISPNSLFIIFFSMITGFPSGSKYITEFYNNNLISIEEANYLLAFTHFSNPLFILGTISRFVGSKVSIIILISHYISNYITAFILRPKNKIINNKSLYKNKHDLITCLNNSFKKTISIIIIVLCFSIIFTTLGSLITSFIHNKTLKLFIFGLLDLTKGTSLINYYNYSLLFKGIIICTFISLGGVNIHMQVNSIIKNKNLRYIYFLHGRLIAVSINIILFIILFTHV